MLHEKIIHIILYNETTNFIYWCGEISLLQGRTWHQYQSYLDWLTGEDHVYI